RDVPERRCRPRSCQRHAVARATQERPRLQANRERDPRLARRAASVLDLQHPRARADRLRLTADRRRCAVSGVETDKRGWRLGEHGKSVPVTDPMLAFDKTMGDVVERLVRRQHRRKLRKRGWERALEPGGDGLWPGGDPPPREGNSIDVLVDGAEALPRMVAELRKARSHVHIAGWYLSPWFDLTHDGTELTPLLAQLAERIDVRVLMWAG